jgi:dienelactone hydrolase
MQLLKALFALLLSGVLYAPAALAQQRFGAQGPENEPDRMQQWLVPSPDPDTAARAILFRPPGDGPFRLALIAHASTQNPLRRAQMPQSEYRALAAWLVARGFAVLVPERPGHGATAGRYLEDQGDCDGADYVSAGRATAKTIAAALNYLRSQPFVRQDGAVIVGHSAGAWGALALAGEKLKGVSAIIAFAAGRGGHANDLPNQVCAPHTLVATAAEFGKGARGAGNMAGGGQRQLFFAKTVAATGRRIPQRRRQRRLSCAGGIRQRGPLACGDRGRRQHRGTGTGTRAEATEPGVGQKTITSGAPQPPAESGPNASLQAVRLQRQVRAADFGAGTPNR